MYLASQHLEMHVSGKGLSILCILYMCQKWGGKVKYGSKMFTQNEENQNEDMNKDEILDVFFFMENQSFCTVAQGRHQETSN